MATANDQRKVVQKLRERFAHVPPTGLKERQTKMAVPAPSPKGIWISQDLFAAPTENNLCDVFYCTVTTASPSDVILPPRDAITLGDVPVEWLGQQKDAPPLRSKLSEQEIFHRLSADSNYEMTILYAHGGAF